MNLRYVIRRYHLRLSHIRCEYRIEREDGRSRVVSRVAPDPTGVAAAAAPPARRSRPNADEIDCKFSLENRSRRLTIRTRQSAVATGGCSASRAAAPRLLWAGSASWPLCAVTGPLHGACRVNVQSRARLRPYSPPCSGMPISAMRLVSHRLTSSRRPLLPLYLIFLIPSASDSGRPTVAASAAHAISRSTPQAGAAGRRSPRAPYR